MLNSNSGSRSPRNLFAFFESLGEKEGPCPQIYFLHVKPVDRWLMAGWLSRGDFPLLYNYSNFFVSRRYAGRYELLINPTCVGWAITPCRVCRHHQHELSIGGSDRQGRMMNARETRRGVTPCKSSLIRFFILFFRAMCVILRRPRTSISCFPMIQQQHRNPMYRIAMIIVAFFDEVSNVRRPSSLYT